MINIDELKKKITYRSNYRGTKEMDKLLGTFVKTYIDKLNEKDLINLEKLLDVDDTNLYNYYNDLKTDFEFENNAVTSLFKNFDYNKVIIPEDLEFLSWLQSYAWFVTLKKSKTVLKIPFKGRYGENTYDKMFKYYSENGLRGNSNTLKKFKDFFFLINKFLKV